MKIKILYYIIVPLVILAAMMPLTLSCTKFCCVEPERPDDIIPIDNNAYNSVGVVYQYYSVQFRDNNYIDGDTVKVYGWMDKHNYNKIYSNDKYTHLYLGCANEDISKKILSIDISKKIFAKGIITVSGNDPDHDSPWITLTITDINDIYTE